MTDMLAGADQLSPAEPRMSCPRFGCGSPLAPGLRYGKTPKPVPSMVCWTCGYETPSAGRCCEQRRVHVDQVPCSECGTEVKRNSERRKYTSGNIYCSVTCYSNAKRGRVIAATCPCGVAFTRAAHRVRDEKRPMYCSASCQRALRTRRVAS